MSYRYRPTGFSYPLIDQIPRLRQVLKNVRVQAARTGKAPHPRLPIAPSILRRVWLADYPTFNNIMLWARSTTTFFGFCRSGEVTVECESKFDPQVHLSLSDLAIDNALAPNVISIKLKHSNLERESLADDLCLVSPLLSYLSHCGNTPGPLF